MHSEEKQLAGRQIRAIRKANRLLFRLYNLEVTR